MASLNQLTLLGNIGKDPEIRSTPGGILIASFSLATSDYAGKDSGGKAKFDTEWHNVKAFGKDAEYVRDNITKGDNVMVIGRVKTDSWEDKNTSEKKFRTGVVIGLKGQVSRLNKRESVSAGGNVSNSTQTAISQPDNDDDIPF